MQKKIVVPVAAFVLVIVLGAGFFFSAYKDQRVSLETAQQPVEVVGSSEEKVEEVATDAQKDLMQSGTAVPASTSVENATQNRPLIAQGELKQNVYFAKMDYGTKIPFLVDVKTGAQRALIPAGYHLADGYEYVYETLPEYMILRKGNEIFSYALDGQVVKKIDGVELKDTERVRLYPSVTEKIQFIVLVTEHDLSKVDEFYGDNPVIGKRTFLFDATKNTLVQKTNIVSDNCFVYDSKNARLLTWRCGEGVADALPVAIADLNGNEIKKIITDTDLGLSDEDVDAVVKVEYGGGTLFARGSDSVIILDPTYSDPVKQKYTLTPSDGGRIAKEFAETYAYSIAVSNETKTIVVGSGEYILLLRFNANHEIVGTQKINEAGVMANFVYTHAGKLYYQASDGAVRVVDLVTWNVERSIPLARAQEYTIISLPE